MSIILDPFTTAQLAAERDQRFRAEAIRACQADLAVNGSRQPAASRVAATVCLTTTRGVRVRMWRAVPRPAAATVP